MAFVGLCEGDPVVKALADVFAASIVRVPEQRIQPLSVVASGKGKAAFRGALTPLLVGDVALDVPRSTSRMTNVSGRRTRSVKTELGLKILGGFLTGFGLPSASIGGAFRLATEVKFSFNDVVRTYVDANLLGRQLVGNRIDKSNPAAAIFFGGDAYQFLVLDSVIGSRDFTIAVTKSSDKSFKLDVPAIQQVVREANIGVSVSTDSGYDLTFTGQEYLTFAFSCVRFHLTPTGTVDLLLPGNLRSLRAAKAKVRDVHHRQMESAHHVLIGAKPALVEFRE